MKLFFHTGSNLSLSTEEIKSFFLQNNIYKKSKDLICVESDLKDNEIKELQKKLGGTIKISKEIGEFSGVEIFSEIINEIKKIKEEREGKLRIGINIFSKEIKLTSIIKEVKKEVKSVRFLNNNFKNIDSIVTKKQILDKGGIELNIFEDKKEKRFFLSKTISVQDIESYKLRDYEKPARSAKVGMLPPKLAQILINLAGEKKSIWDPFVGTGTILMEGFLMGIKELYGSDISEEMINYSNININWLIEKTGFKNEIENGKLKIENFTHDASLENKLKVDTVVSEGYLGIPLEDFATQSFIEKNDKVLAKIWEGALENFANNGIKKVVFCLPCYPNRKGNRFFCKKTLEIIQKSQYNPLVQNLIYGRNNQFVHRQVQVLELSP